MKTYFFNIFYSTINFIPYKITLKLTQPLKLNIESSKNKLILMFLNLFKFISSIIMYFLKTII